MDFHNVTLFMNMPRLIYQYRNMDFFLKFLLSLDSQKILGHGIHQKFE